MRKNTVLVLGKRTWFEGCITVQRGETIYFTHDSLKNFSLAYNFQLTISHFGTENNWEAILASEQTGQGDSGADGDARAHIEIKIVIWAVIVFLGGISIARLGDIAQDRWQREAKDNTSAVIERPDRHLVSNCIVSYFVELAFMVSFL